MILILVWLKIDLTTIIINNSSAHISPVTNQWKSPFV